MIRYLLLGLIGLLVPTNLVAQSRSPIELSRMKVGLPAGPFSGDEDRTDGGFQGIFKSGVFTPVYVDISAFETINEPLELVVEVGDPDNSLTSARVPIPSLQKGESLRGVQLGRIPYLKPGITFTDTVTAYVQTVKSQRRISNQLERSVAPRDSSDFLIVSVGGSINNFRLPRLGSIAENDPDYNKHRGGKVELAQCLEVGQLPDHWIGYSAFDLMVIATGGEEKFWQELRGQPARQQAILEWVRRGGRVAISLGFNLDQIIDLPLVKELLPATIPADSKKSVEFLQLNWIGTDKLTKNFRLEGGAGTIATVDFTPKADRSFRSIAPPEATRRDAKPVIIQGSYGLGKVTVVGFDLDRTPFADWDKRAVFWEWLSTEAGSRLPDPETSGRFDRDDPQFTLMNDMLDSFEGVPVISFGWVALFILAYILLIGPIDYLFLKKVLKRLEWTWVTFPLIVLTVSAIAYFAAYAIKGKDQKINKYDFVDIDLETKRVYGQTWFTIFSPRIQNYNIGVEPVGPASNLNDPKWVIENAAESAPNTVVSWNSQLRETGRSILQRKYRYHSDYTNADRPLIAAGLEEVPIQVWSTKSFTASWSGAIDPAKPLISHTLHHPPGESDTVIGSITSNLPVSAAGDIWVIYRDRATKIDQLVPGVEKAIVLKESDEPLNSAFGTMNVDFGLVGSGGGRPGTRTDSFGVYRLYGVLFGDRLGNVDRPMAHPSIRSLDQSWRIRENNPDQAILLIRLPATKDSAESQLNNPASPSRLWLNEFPGGEASRTPIQGTLRQETYIRVFIPIPRLAK